MSFMQKRIEKDFEFFVKALPKLEPVEFCGLAKLLSVPMTKSSVEFSKEEFENLEENEAIGAKLEEALLPMDEVLEKMMDRFLSLNKKRRNEINKILKEIIKSKNGVKNNGATT